MKRRHFLVAATPVAFGILSGCISDSDHGEIDSSQSTTTSSDNNFEIDGEALDPGDFHTHEGIRVKANRFYSENSVEYTDHDSGEIKEWDPDGKKIAFASFTVENLTDEEKDIPYWDNFLGVSTSGEHQPKSEMPDGNSVEDINSDSIENGHSPHWVTSSGIVAEYSRIWNAVYVASDVDPFAVRWKTPDPSPHWVFEDRP